MRITHVDICDLHAFKFAGISSLQGTFTETLQIILGTNGSGKTNLIKQLSPLPPVRSDYGPNGYRRLVIEHQGDVYELISDYANKTSPHAFIRNKKSLNEGGTTNVQVEMIEAYLGWTTEVQHITYGDYDFCKMTTGARRALLLNANPKNIGFIFDYYKKTGSKVRYCKNNLHALQERKALIESKLLDPAITQRLSVEKEGLMKKTFELTDLMGKIKAYISNNRPDRTTSLGAWNEVRQELLDLCSETRYSQWTWKDIDRSKDEDQLIATITEDLGYVSGKLHTLDTQLIEVTQTLNQCEFNLSELTEQERVDEKKILVKSLHDEITTLSETSTDDPLPKSVLQNEDLIVLKLNNILERFIDCSVTLKSRKIINLKKQKFYHIDQRRVHLLDRQSSLFAERDKLNAELVIKLSDIPESNCAKMACPLFRSFKNTHDHTSARLSAIQDALSKIEGRLSRYQTYLTAQHTQLISLEIYAQAGDALQEFITEYPHLRKFFSEQNTLLVLQTNPLSFLHKVKDYFLRSSNAYLLKEKQDLLLKEEIELSKIAELSHHEKGTLLKQLESLRRQHTTLHADKSRLTHERLSLQETKQTLLSRKTVLAKIKSLQESLQVQADTLKSQEEISFLQSLLTDLIRENEKHFSRIGEIDQTLREQDNLQSRYTEEVVSQISKLEKDKIKWEELEYALNRIPQWHTATFLNLIIKLINHYISLVFTYTFELMPIDPDKNLDYRFSFKAQCPDRESVVEVNDISLCSRAQMDIVNFAFCLALRRIKDLSNYPLFTDELGSSFDVAHKTHVLDLLKHLVDENLVSQIFLINHHALVHEGMANAEVLILNDANIMKPARYNEHVKMIKK